MLLLALSGCASLSLPTSVPTPMLRHAGEVEASAQIGTNGFDLAVDAALADQFVVGGLLSWNQMTGMKNVDSQHLYAEGMFGYNKVSTKGSLFSLYAGVGSGHTVVGAQEAQYADVKKLFAQVLFGTSLSRPRRGGNEAMKMEGGVTLRATVVTFMDPGGAGMPRVLDNAYYVEPRIFMRAVWDMFSVGLQGGMKVPLDVPGGLDDNMAGVAMTMTLRLPLVSDPLPETPVDAPSSAPPEAPAVD